MPGFCIPWFVMSTHLHADEDCFDRDYVQVGNVDDLGVPMEVFKGSMNFKNPPQKIPKPTFQAKPPFHRKG